VREQTARRVKDALESINQASATAIGQLIRSPTLRKGGTDLKVPVNALVVAPGYDNTQPKIDGVVTSVRELTDRVSDLAHAALAPSEIEETRSILEGAKALVRSNRRRVEDRPHQELGAALAALEDQIATFDAKQRSVALTTLRCPTRIRGLAGSGKTVILAMKAALAHLDDPDANILVTYYTRSLRHHLTRLIARFYRHFGEGEPDWKRIHVRHGWGRKDFPGVYREASVRNGLVPLDFTTAQAAAGRNRNAFEYACRNLVDSRKIEPHYDLILIDEGQDFPGAFYELCFQLAKGSRDEKQIVWAYDELQNVFEVTVRTPEQLFGLDADGEPRISLNRSLPTGADTNDFVLPKCYRNQRNILVLAHATGFGIYGEPVQMLQGKAHWEDVGYDVETEDMRPGAEVVIRRPDRNSPTHLNTPEDTPLIEIKRFDSVTGEVEYCADQFLKFIAGGLQPEDLMAIAADDRGAQRYLSHLSQALAIRGIESNNIIADRYSEPDFVIQGKCTLSTVYRAKGNEGAVVAVLGCDAVPLRTRGGRNRLFTAFTRTKGWLRITGAGSGFLKLEAELNRALAIAPEMRFIMPDPKRIELIQRDLADKDTKAQRVREELERLKEELDLSDDDIAAMIRKKGRPRNG
jgi:superfamily I DNA and RNA helicase